MRTIIGKIGNEILDLVYPPGLYCLSCGKITDDSRTYGLCNECMSSMNWVSGRHCGKCGRPLSPNDPGELCFGCAGKRSSGQLQAFDRGHACAGYGACERALIFNFKYGGRSDIGETLGGIIYDRMKAEYGGDALQGMYDLVIPVPIYRKRKSMRGFNHAELMAKSFAKKAGLRFEANLVMRARETAPMKGLGPEERQANIRGAFRIRESLIQLIDGARILIIDDIFTTGATVDEIASMLKDYGAAKVDFLAFAAAGDMIRS